jgi:hypothetical protein
MRGWRRLSKWSGFVYLIDVWILPVLGASIAIWWIVAFLRHDTATVDAISYLGCIGTIAAIGLPLLYWGKMRLVYRQRTALSNDGHVVLEFDDSSIRFTLPSKVEVVYAWNAFTSYFEDDQVATLFSHKAAFHTIPKRAMSAESLAEFNELVDKHVRRRPC